MPKKKKSLPKNPQKDLSEEIVDKMNNLGFGESNSVNLSNLLKQLEMPEDNQENQTKK